MSTCLNGRQVCRGTIVNRACSLMSGFIAIARHLIFLHNKTIKIYPKLNIELTTIF